MSTDTSPEAAAAHLAILRAATIEKRLRACFGFSRSIIALSRAALRARHPELSEQDANLLWVEQNYGRELAEGVRAKLQATACRSRTTLSPR